MAVFKAQFVSEASDEHVVVAGFWVEFVAGDM
jgi:hypothetical protein